MTTKTTTTTMIATTKRYRNRPSAEGCGLWTTGEHTRFLQALTVYPSGPWRAVAAFVGTRNVRQTMTHAQKHKQKIARHERGLRSKKHSADASEPALFLRQQDLELLPTPPATTTYTPAPTSIPTPTSTTTPTRTTTPTPTVMDKDTILDVEVDHDLVALLPLTCSAVPLTIHAPIDLKLELGLDNDLATPVVSDCLDYLVQCFVY